MRSQNRSLTNTVIQCDMSPECAFFPDKSTVYYWDAFETDLTQVNLSMTKIYLGIFSHLPAWGEIVVGHAQQNRFGIWHFRAKFGAA